MTIVCHCEKQSHQAIHNNNVFKYNINKLYINPHYDNIQIKMV